MSVVPSLTNLPAIFTHATAGDLGVSDHYLYGWRDEGTIEQIARGIFRKHGVAGDPDLIEIAVRAPLATLCLATALARHGLTDEIPASIDAALPRKQRLPRTSAPVTWHRFDEATFEIDRHEFETAEGVNLWLYGPMRSIIDAFRLRHLEGHEQANEALRRWLRQRGSHPARLLKVVRHFPQAERSVRTALQILT